MASTFLNIFVSLLLVSSIQGKPYLHEDELFEEIKQWIHDKIYNAIDDLKKAEQDLRETVEKALDEHRNELETEYANSMIEYHSHHDNLHPTCFQNGLQQLTQYPIIDVPTLSLFESVNFADNISTTPVPNCVTAACQDVGRMIYEVAEYISFILNTFDDILNGYSLCSKTLIKKFTCIFTYAFTAIKDIYNVISGVFQLIGKLTSLGKDIAQQIHRCTHPSKLQIQEHFLMALNNAQTCTKMYKDNNYKYLHYV